MSILGSCEENGSAGTWDGAVKPPRFDYVAPTKLHAALTVLAEGEDAKILAGGQSLVPLLNMRLAMPALLVDINRIEDAPGLDDSERLCCGPLVRLSELERHVTVNGRFPLLAEALGWVGHPQIRNRGTVLGSLAHADPAAEMPVAFLALDAEMTIAGVGGSRTVGVQDFFVHVMETVVAPDEILVGASVPTPASRSGGAFLEVARRHGDFAVASAAVVVEMDGPTIVSARIALGGVAPVPIQAVDAETHLAGGEQSPLLFREAAKLARNHSQPVSDVHGTAEYRRDLVEALTIRGLNLAVERALKGRGDG